MRTSVVGYPRVGGLRELKFASEKYFRKEISAEQLQDTAAHIRKEQWLLEKASGLDFIPSNDFSFYDNLLDTAVLFNVVPKRYQALNLSPLDTYFAMARGYQGEEGDVKALPMKKWFNTNYHYIVPELETDTEIFLAGNAPKEAFLEARALGVETKPVIVGAYTFLKLCKFPAEKTLSDYAPALIKAYIQLLHQLEEAGAQWIQFDEPCLVYDLSPKDLALFQALYTSILSAKKETHILLQTYFGDIRDCYAQVIALPFDGIGLDFAEGRKTLQLVTSQGFPAKQILFAGVVNGKNIWRNSYAKTLEILRKLQSLQIETVINTSCSLLHVPYSLKQETRLPEAYKSHFAFAQEKLTELEELKTLTQEDGEASPLYQENLRLFSSRPDCTNPAVEARVQAIKETDFVRQPSFSQREATQKSRFKLPLFPTTTIGSFPQTIEVKRQRAAFKKGELSREAYVDFIQKQKNPVWGHKSPNLLCCRLNIRNRCRCTIQANEFFLRPRRQYFGGRCFSRAGRTIKNHIGKVFLTNKSPQYSIFGDKFFLTDYFVQCFRPNTVCKGSFH